MSPRVKLSSILGSIGFQTHNTSCYLDKQRGQIFLVSKDHLRAAEKDDELKCSPGQQKEQIKLAREILTDKKGEKYILIPGKFVYHEYSTMENFCLSLKDRKISKPLCQAIFGGGAFNRFKNCIHRYGIADDWYRYRFNAMKKIVIDWCEANDIEYVEK